MPKLIERHILGQHLARIIVVAVPRGIQILSMLLVNNEFDFTLLSLRLQIGLRTCQLAQLVSAFLLLFKGALLFLLLVDKEVRVLVLVALWRKCGGI